MSDQGELAKPSSTFHLSALKIFILVFLFGIFCLFIAHLLHDQDSAWQPTVSAIVREIGALSIVGGGLHQLWEHFLRRSFAMEILKMARAGTDLETAKIKSFKHAENFNQHVTWQPRIANSQTMQVVITYGKTWRRLVEQDLKTFASKGKKLTLYLPNYKNAPLMAALAQQFNQTPNHVINEILDALNDFQGYFFGHPNNLVIKLIDKQPHLTIYRFDHEVIVALPKYSSGRGDIFVLEATNDGTFANFIEKELHELDKSSTTAISPGAQSAIPQAGSNARTAAQQTPSHKA